MSDKDIERISPDDSDMRYFPRWESDEPVIYRLDGESESFEGTTKDISCAGACIIGGWNMKPNQKIHIAVQLSQKTTIRVRARILWSQIKNGQPQMGVTFYNTTDQVRDSILKHAFELDRDKVVNQWFKGWGDS